MTLHYIYNHSIFKFYTFRESVLNFLERLPDNASFLPTIIRSRTWYGFVSLARLISFLIYNFCCLHLDYYFTILFVFPLIFLLSVWWIFWIFWEMWFLTLPHFLDDVPWQIRLKVEAGVNWSSVSILVKSDVLPGDGSEDCF